MPLFGPPDVGKMLIKHDAKGLVNVLEPHHDYSIRMQSAKALGLMDDKSAIGPLLKVAQYDKNHQVRLTAVIALEKLGYGDILASVPSLSHLGNLALCSCRLDALMVQ
jgi:HEAT repeat protein